MIRSAPQRAPPQMPLLRRDYKLHPNLDAYFKVVQRELTMDRYLQNKKFPKYTVRIDFNSFHLLLRSGEGRHPHLIPLFTVCEVRVGAQALACKVCAQLSFDTLGGAMIHSERVQKKNRLGVFIYL